MSTFPLGLTAIKRWKLNSNLSQFLPKQGPFSEHRCFADRPRTGEGGPGPILPISNRDAARLPQGGRNVSTVRGGGGSALSSALTKVSMQPRLISNLRSSAYMEASSMQ